MKNCLNYLFKWSLWLISNYCQINIRIPKDTTSMLYFLSSCYMYIFCIYVYTFKIFVCIFNWVWMRTEAFVQTVSCLSFQNSIGNCEWYNDTCYTSRWECCPMLVYSRHSSPEWLLRQMKPSSLRLYHLKKLTSNGLLHLLQPWYCDSLRSPLEGHPRSEFMGVWNIDGTTISR